MQNKHHRHHHHPHHRRCCCCSCHRQNHCHCRCHTAAAAAAAAKLHYRHHHLQPEGTNPPTCNPVLGGEATEGTHWLCQKDVTVCQSDACGWNQQDFYCADNSAPSASDCFLYQIKFDNSVRDLCGDPPPLSRECCTAEEQLTAARTTPALISARKTIEVLVWFIKFAGAAMMWWGYSNSFDVAHSQKFVAGSWLMPFLAFVVVRYIIWGPGLCVLCSFDTQILFHAVIKHLFASG